MKTVIVTRLARVPPLAIGVHRRGLSSQPDNTSAVGDDRGREGMALLEIRFLEIVRRSYTTGQIIKTAITASVTIRVTDRSLLRDIDTSPSP